MRLAAFALVLASPALAQSDLADLSEGGAPWSPRLDGAVRVDV